MVGGAEGDLADVHQAMNVVVAGMVKMVGLIEVLLHGERAVLRVVGGTDEAEVVGTEVSEADTELVGEEGLPVLLDVDAGEREPVRLVESHLDRGDGTGRHPERIVSVQKAVDGRHLGSEEPVHRSQHDDGIDEGGGGEEFGGRSGEGGPDELEHG